MSPGFSHVFNYSDGSCCGRIPASKVMSKSNQRFEYVRYKSDKIHKPLFRIEVLSVLWQFSTWRSTPNQELVRTRSAWVWGIGNMGCCPWGAAGCPWRSASVAGWEITILEKLKTHVFQDEILQMPHQSPFKRGKPWNMECLGCLGMFGTGALPCCPHHFRSLPGSVPVAFVQPHENLQHDPVGNFLKVTKAIQSKLHGSSSTKSMLSVHVFELTKTVGQHRPIGSRKTAHDSSFVERGCDGSIHPLVSLAGDKGWISS